MPTVTNLFGIGFVNNGPLTTTYTPPASCATGTTDQIIFADTSTITLSFGEANCTAVPLGICLPSNSTYDKLNSKWRQSGGQGTIDYFSPGIYCPKGWTTAATFAHGDKTGSPKRGGAFTETTSSDPGETASVMNPYMPIEQIWLNALDPSETLAYCCPSGWTARKRGGCYSFIEPLESATAYSEMCNIQTRVDAIHEVSTIEGRSLSQYMYSFETGVRSTATTALSELREVLETNSYYDYSSLAVVRYFPAVKLVYKESDLKPTGDGGGDDDEEKADDDKEEEDDNGSSRLLRSGGLVSIIAVLFSMLIGAGLVML
ncbi:hypothetical protein FGADI_11030 [Fusarium gaditjirri]|uniref:Uncharacterized protein n=1 Tax=Fusarium gaditjirri TaxID=282569 RepID=A0A8H4SVK0_9HYPO|nr:hypothetical protein FGADI_11030 [Fusarium gaditjirri]